ncbi:MAG: DUF6434 domain-containing protein [Pseudomonadota bacterium]
MTDTGLRPAIDSIRDGAELRRWYWRKAELVDHARSLGVKIGGGKFELLDRIAHFLDTGERDQQTPKQPKPRSTFDWHSADLADETVITDNYKNTQNVRRYFKSRLGAGFSFNIAFMDWMRTNTGKTLADAVTAYGQIKAAGKAKGPGTTIRDHNQFNQYTRDFLKDNPGLGPADVRRIWALKIQTPSDTGRHRYHPSDLDLERTMRKAAT